jgi:hypothetical protein
MYSGPVRATETWTALLHLCLAALLPYRAVLMLPLASKEAVIDHALRKQEDQQSQDSHKHELPDCSPARLLL